MEEEILEKLGKAIFDSEKEAAVEYATKAMEENIPPMKAIEALTKAIRKVGDGFESGTLFLPDMVGAAATMQLAMPIIEANMKSGDAEMEKSGVVVIGTVAGDLHTIGKSMVISMLAAEGFEVHDLGVDVAKQTFIEAVKKYSPDILAMSALLTTTAPQAKKVINTLAEEKLRSKIKILVGGGAITRGFAQEIGADGYEPTAPGAAKLAKNLLNI